MAFKTGFYNSVGEDRKYNAEDMCRPYRRLVSNGVFAAPDGSPSIDFQVVANNNMTVTVKAGEGIFFTSRMMDNFFISSGGKIFTTSKYNNDIVFDINECLSGTCVFMSLSNFTKRTPREIFDLYSNVDGAFTTTRIPLKNIFDSAPVSRSQAKRVCNRLETFEEVILDFDGISWMGQGFAHQMFVVYKNAHPNVTIKPVNMNDSVEKMYNHVVR